MDTMGRSWRAIGLSLSRFVAVVMALGPGGIGAEESGNMVFFRGGYAAMTSDRGGELFTDANRTAGYGNRGNGGYYVGAGMDLMLSKDTWGLGYGISTLGEIGVEFKRFNSRTTINTGNLSVGGCTGCTPAPAALTVQNVTPSTEQITMLTVDVAPKIKFMDGSRFRPWVIPVGLDFHVISPPSGRTTVLDVGVQFGAGAEYTIWKTLKLGLDGRFHLASNQTQTVNNFGTVGGYVGIGF